MRNVMCSASEQGLFAVPSTKRMPCQRKPCRTESKRAQNLDPFLAFFLPVGLADLLTGTLSRNRPPVNWKSPVNIGLCALCEGLSTGCANAVQRCAITGLSASASSPNCLESHHYDRNLGVVFCGCERACRRTALRAGGVLPTACYRAPHNRTHGKAPEKGNRFAARGAGKVNGAATAVLSRFA